MAKRILVRNQGPDEKNVAKAFAVALKEAKANGAKTIYLVVPAKSAFSGNIVSKFLGDGPTRQLLKGNSVEIKDGISVKLESPDTLRNATTMQIVLTAYVGGKDLRTIDGLRGLTSMIFLPWLSDEGEGWQQSWNAEVLGEKLSESQLQLNPDLEKMLTSLTVRVNLSTGLGHPLDLRAAKEMFASLADGAIPFEPAAIRSWALRNGWRPDFAEDLYRLASQASAERGH